MRGRAPRRDVEALLAAEHGLVAAVDEVGRGALAGPVTVGVVLVDVASLARPAPRGLRDSKLLTADQRVGLVDRIERWVVAHAVAQAGADEIDAVGIIAALRRAGERALASLPCPPGVVLLDGSHDWLTRRPPVAQTPTLFDMDGSSAVVEMVSVAKRELPDPAAHPDPHELPRVRRPDPQPRHDEDVPRCAASVVTRVKADLTCAAVAAASVLAKVDRDSVMVRLHEEHPEFGWRDNKGYAAPDHRRALERLGPSPWHRQSWRLSASEAADARVVAGT